MAGPAPFRTWPCRRRRLARWRHIRILGQTALWRKEFERLDSGAWRFHGPARWIYRGCGFRGHRWRRARGGLDRCLTVRMDLNLPMFEISRRATEAIIQQ